MQAKGTTIKAIVKYVETKHPDRYQEWLQALPKASRSIVSDYHSAQWYDLMDALVIPTQSIGDLFFNGDHEMGAWQNGRYNAELSLRGIYWFYVKAGNPSHIISRTSRIFSAYYQPADMIAENQERKSVDVVIKSFEMPNAIVEARIAGWMERALEISGCKNIQLTIPASLTLRDKETRFCMKWD